MKNTHILQLESVIKRTLSDIIQNEVKNNIGMVTVTDVDLTTDYSYLTVYYTVLSKKDGKRAYDGLNSSKGFIRTALVNRVSMRKAPELIFKLDESFEKGERIDALLEQIKKEEMKKTPNE